MLTYISDVKVWRFNNDSKMTAFRLYILRNEQYDEYIYINLDYVNPNCLINCKSQYSEKANVCCRIQNQRLICPSFIDGSMFSGNVFQLLINKLSDAIDELSLSERKKVISAVRWLFDT